MQKNSRQKTWRTWENLDSCRMDTMVESIYEVTVRLANSRSIKARTYQGFDRHGMPCPLYKGVLYVKARGTTLRKLDVATILCVSLKKTIANRETSSRSQR